LRERRRKRRRKGLRILKTSSELNDYETSYYEYEDLFVWERKPLKS